MPRWSQLVHAAALACVFGCGSTKQQPEPRALPEPLVAAELPDRPDQKPIDPKDSWVIAVNEGTEVPAGKSGILMSQQKAARAARYVVAYDELRQLYVIDLKTWGRERQVYEQHLRLSEEETMKWREAARRTWWEDHRGEIGLATGIVLGIAASVLAVEAIGAAAQ